MTVTLTLPPVDVDGDGSDEQGVFVFEEEFSLTPSIATGFLVGEGGRAINQVIANKVDDGASKYKNFHINLGTGRRAIVLDINSKTGDGTEQWGSTGDDSQTTIADATGGTAFEKLQVLDHYLQVATPDSSAPAELEFGGYSPGGLFTEDGLSQDHLDVVIQEPELTWDPSTSPSSFSGQLTFVETITDDEIIDAAQRALKDLV